MSNAPTASSADPDYFSYFCLVCLAICLGSTFLFQFYALKGMNAPAAGGLRLVFCAAALVPAALIAGHGLPRDRVSWSWAGFNGLIGFFLPFNLTIWALQYVETGVAAVIYSVIPLFVLALSRLVLGVNISARKWFGLALGTLGLVILSLPSGSVVGGAETPNSWFGLALLAKFVVMISTVMLAMASIAIRKMPPTPPLAAMAAASLVAAGFSLPILVYAIPSSQMTANAIAAIAAAGIFSTALGQTIRYFLVRRTGPVFIAPTAYLAAGVATILGVVFLDEAVTLILLVGFAVILLGLIIAQDGTGKMEQV